MTTFRRSRETGWNVFCPSPWRLALTAGSFDQAASVADRLGAEFRIAYGAKEGQHYFVPLAEPVEEVSPSCRARLS
jgi:hypothetical protein